MKEDFRGRIVAGRETSIADSLDSWTFGLGEWQTRGVRRGIEGWIKVYRPVAVCVKHG